MPIDQRKWKDIHPVDYVDKGSLSCRVSKTITQVLRHQGSHREDDGTVDWITLLHVLCRDCESAPKWTNPELFGLLHKGSGKDRFQYCQNSDGFIHCMRAIQGHSGGNNVDPSLPAPISSTLSTPTSSSPVHRNQDSCLAVLPNSFRSQDKHLKTRGFVDATQSKMHNQSWTSRRCRGESVLDFGMR